MPQCSLVEKAQFQAGTMLVQTLALPLTAGDLGEIKFFYQLECCQKPPSSSLKWSGYLLFLKKSTGRTGSGVGQFCGLGSYSIFPLCQTPYHSQLLFWAPSLSWFTSIHYGIQERSEPPPQVWTVCLSVWFGHLCPLLDQWRGLGFPQENKGGTDVGYTTNSVHYSSKPQFSLL